MARFIVLEDATPAAVEEAVAELAGDGARVVSDWVTSCPRPTVCAGRVTAEGDAARAVLAAVAGARLVVAAAAPRDVIDRLCDDLRRLGELEHRVAPAERPVLTVEQRRLLGHLLAGSTLGEAARALHLSRRTADRRLAEARAALGAASTADALRRAAALGVRPPG